jgi:HK97 family phage major capsid protein
MKTVKELRQERAEKIAGMTRLNVAAEGEERDLTEDEKVEYDGLKTAAALLAERIARLEEAQELEEDVTRSQGTKAQGETRGKAPAYNKMPLGDSETRAFAHWIKTGDDGGIRELRASNATDMNIGTNVDGQYLVPTGHYNQVIARRDEAMLANQIGVMNIPGQGTTVNVPVDNEADGEFVATNEAAEFDLDAPATAQVAMTLVKYTKQIKISYELLEDEDAKLLTFLSDFVGRGMAKTHNSLLLTEARAGGTAALTLDSASTIGDGEPVELLYKQPAEYLDGSVWVMARATEGAIRGNQGDPFLYNPNPSGSDRGRPEILGYPVYNSAAASAIAASAKSVIFGNFRYMGMREAPGITFLRDPYSLAYLGQVRLLYYFRTVYKTLQAEAIQYATHPTA